MQICENSQKCRFSNFTSFLKGNDGGKIHEIRLLTSKRHHGVEFQCKITKKLDNEEFETVNCNKTLTQVQNHLTCNGNEKFCHLKFNETTFAGAHNAGTGMSTVLALDCFVTNHDLNITEMLDFGLRFFDFDVKYYE